MNMTYKESGVDIDYADDIKKSIAETLDEADSNIINKVGAFASLYEFNFPDIKKPVLVLKSEEPGSKQLLALKCNKVESICYDMINHLINDCVIMGAKPLVVQDVIVSGKLDKNIILRMIKAMSNACKENGCVLSGGETSEQPKVIDENTYILTSSIVGVVDKDKIIDGSKICENDVVIALGSSGLHTNGYTLIRKLIDDNFDILTHFIDGKAFMDIILEPHRCYYNSLKDLFPLDIINGLAHITSGGIKGNLNRILPNNLNAEINIAKIKTPSIFQFIQNKADLSFEEMYKTFNMGVGVTLITNEEYYNGIISHFKNFNIDAYEIGKINQGNKCVEFIYE